MKKAPTAGSSGLWLPERDQAHKETEDRGRAHYRGLNYQRTALPFLEDINGKDLLKFPVALLPEIDKSRHRVATNVSSPGT